MGHDSAVKLVQWRGRVSKKDFRKEFMAAVIATALLAALPPYVASRGATLFVERSL